MVRKSFRTVQDGTLSTKTCERCSTLLYRVDTGLWLHWTTLQEACRIDSAPIALSKRQEGAKLATVGLDTPARGLARARCDASYRRPSWEWVGCK